MPLSLPDLTLPQGSTATVRQVLNGWMRGLVRDFAAIPPNFLPVGTRALFQRTNALVQAELKRDPRRVVQMLRQPTHASLLGTIAHHARGDGDLVELARLVRELCLLVLLDLAREGSLPSSGVVVPKEGDWPKLRSLEANLEIAVDDEVEAVAFGPHRVVARARGRDFPVDLASPNPAADKPISITRPYHVVVDGVRLGLTDNNPLSHFEAHPDKQGNQLDLGGHPVDEWLQSLRDAFALVDRYLPELGEELRLVVRLVVPVGWHAEKHLSASYREAVGIVYMTLHPHPMTMTEALIHEFQHNKLNAVLNLDPLLENAFFPLYSSPVRPDPRPLHGVVLAVHAFQPVAMLYEKMLADDHPLSRHPSFLERYRNIIRMDRAGARTVLENARPTEPGAGLFAEMRALDEALGAIEARRWDRPAEGLAPDLPVDE